MPLRVEYKIRLWRSKCLENRWRTKKNKFNALGNAWNKKYKKFITGPRVAIRNSLQEIVLTQRENKPRALPEIRVSEVLSRSLVPVHLCIVWCDIICFTPVVVVGDNNITRDRSRRTHKLYRDEPLAFHAPPH